MKNKRIFSRFLATTMVAAAFGFVSVLNVFGQTDTATTSTNINNTVPAFTAHTTESWVQAYAGTATTDARAASSATFPTNEGTVVTFSATAHDNNGDNYYLIVCDAAGVAAVNNGAPTCTGTAICTSASTANDATATCQKSTTGLALETYNWHSYVCDHNGASICSAASNTSQGGTHAEVGASATPAGSPFHVNHRPTFTAAAITAVNPGTAPTFSNTADADGDSQGAQDTFSLYVCSGESDMGGVTTAFDARALSCTGGTTLCSDTLNGTGDNATCNDGTAITAIPTAHGNYSVYYVVVDSHGFVDATTEATFANNEQTFNVNDVAPVLTSYTTTEGLTSVPGVSSIPANGSVIIARAVTFTDDNGDNDPTLLDMVFFDKVNASDACTAAEKTCYRRDAINLASPPAGCTVTGRSVAGTGKTAQGLDNSLSVSCDFEIWFNATASNWEVSGTATDGGNPAVNFADSAVNTEVAALSAIGVAEASIAYGTLTPSATSTYSAATHTTMQNQGNQIIDVLLSGTNMTADTYTIAAVQQKWDHTGLTFDYGTSTTAFALVTTPNSGCTPGVDCADAHGCLNRNLAVRVVHNVGTEDRSLSWKILIPGTQESGSYTGMNTFSSTGSTDCTGTAY